MKIALTILLSCATFSWAQNAKIVPPAQAPAQKAAPQTDAQQPQADPADPQEFKRLASVTWDLDSHKLVWVVQRGPEINGVFTPKTTDKYEVSPSEASMALRDEKRGIAGDEASSLHELLSVLSMYCVESTVWWEAGGNADTPAPALDQKPGSKTDGKSGPADPDSKPTRVDKPAAKPAVTIPGTKIAELMVK